MAGISNIIGAYNINPRRISSKLSFEVGQIFAAKIIAASDLNKELILRLLDGWQFPAKLENPLEFVPEGLLKFQVEGFQDGKLQIKIINNKKEDQALSKSSLEDILLESNIDVDKEDFEILKQMVKHNMPLTKENISRVKTIIDFNNKISDDSSEEDKFIFKYASNKNIDLNSEKGKNIEKILKGFFHELKNLTEDEMFTMLENGIELTEENIKSFKKVFTEDSTIYKEVKNIEKELKQLEGIKQNNESNNIEEYTENKNMDNIKLNIKEKIDRFSSEIKSDEEAYTILKVLESEIQKENVSPEELKLYKGLKELMESKLENFNILNSKIKKDEQVALKDMESNIDNEPDTKEMVKVEGEKLKNVDDKLKDIIKFDKKEIENVVKQQLTNKTEEIKEVIKNLLQKENNTESKAYEKIMNIIKENINDFKIFNSISNQYYYMDVPISMDKNEYQCKLMIKDDRKSGKKIDSKNVSLVVSVKTVNIGIVDAYIKVRDQNMNVDIKCQENWIKILSAGKNIVLNELASLGYNVFINVDKKETEANLANCQDFFEDSDLNSINIRV